MYGVYSATGPIGFLSCDFGPWHHDQIDVSNTRSAFREFIQGFRRRAGSMMAPWPSKIDELLGVTLLVDDGTSFFDVVVTSVSEQLARDQPLRIRALLHSGGSVFRVNRPVRQSTSSPEYNGLRQDIEDNPTDPAPHLILADWCEDNGVPEMAAFQRGIGERAGDMIKVGFPGDGMSHYRRCVTISLECLPGAIVALLRQHHPPLFSIQPQHNVSGNARITHNLWLDYLSFQEALLDAFVRNQWRW